VDPGDQPEGDATAAPEVAVWLATPSEALAREGEALLSAAERERCDRFQHQGARAEFLTGRWLIRTTLGLRLGLSPTEVPICIGEHGALHLRPGTGDEDLRFNLSHTRGLVALAIAAGRAVGVDVEDRERQSGRLAIAERFFAPGEVAALRQVTPEQAFDRFLDYWTLKEAYIKARGLGLAIPLKRFAFELDGPGPVTVRFDPELGDDPNRWSFERVDPTPRHRLALALASRRPPVLTVEWASSRR